MLLHAGEAFIKVVRGIEERKEKLAATSFRFLEALYVPQDYMDICDKMLGEKHQTLGKFRDITNEVLQARWWHWNLLHPHNEMSVVHPSRSMTLYPLPSPVSPVLFSNCSPSNESLVLPLSCGLLV